MAYSKTNWVDRSVQYPNRFTRATANGYDTLTPAPGTVTQAGTPITADNLNKMENGISDVDSRLTSVEGKYVAGSQSGTRFEVVTAFFFTNGASNTSTAFVTFGTAFSAIPSVTPSNIIAVVPYGDVILYPYIYNISTTGFSAKINAADGALLGDSTPTNLTMNFLVFGK